MGRLIFCLFILCTSCMSSAQESGEEMVFSQKMNKKIPVWVFLPADYATNQDTLPVLYFLHGATGSAKSTAEQMPELQDLATQYQMIIICADGGYTSWYFDSPIDSTVQYETFISQELVAWADSSFRTTQSKYGRAISGLSMGGHGALYLSFKHPEIFGAAGSMSGGVDFRGFPNSWDIAKRLGSYQSNKNRWNRHTVINMLELAGKAGLTLLIDCGTEDFFFSVNQQLHAEMLKRKIQHDYTERAGAHNWVYWKNSMQYHALFFHNFFKKE